DVEVMLTPVSFLENESLTYKKDGVTVLSVNSNGTIPNDFFLSSGYPNPFNSTIRLSYGLPEATDVTISIYDLTGRMVESLVNNNQLAGVYDVTWKSAGKNTASGIYFVRMLAGDFKGVRKVTYIK
ncbi:MAG: T9SS type A sorting domain-containing protein, partial [Calditrichaeota bacterium]|nr:T9SS type A sorting domain-containing protein [Calditrichota bacterium]